MRTWLRAHVPAGWNARAVVAAWILLACWALGLLVAAFQLDHWRLELSRTLMQLNADAHFRARVQDREAVDPEWYRRKALALLSATEKLQQDSLWTLFIPGSWGALDRLEAQVQARLAREFSDIVVETVRRELYARTAQLTGVPLVRGTGDLHAGQDCRSPVPQSAERALTAAAEDLAEFRAVADYVRGVERLDAAVRSFLSLQDDGGEPEQLRELVAYTLGKELPGALAGSVRMFHAGDEVNIQPALMQARLQWATRCSLAKAMSALHARLLATNDLFALEQGLAERSSGLFEPAARPAAFDRTLERYRAVHALLEDQHALLARGRNDWMGQATLQLGPAYGDVLARIGRTGLLGPEVVRQLQDQSGAAFAQFRRQFEQAFGGRDDPGITWLASEGRFGLSPQRAALRQGLGALLQASFMAEDSMPATATGGRAPASLAKVVQEAQALVVERSRIRAEVVPVFPPRAQPAVARVVDARVSEVIYQRAYRAFKAAWPEEPAAPLDPVAFRQQREQVTALQALLKETGGSRLGERLVATLDGELLRRLAPLDEAWKREPLAAARLDDFEWWQGEPLPLAQAVGALEPGAAQPSLGGTAHRLVGFVQQARPLLALGGSTFAADPLAARWLQLQSEAERYAARAPESSLARLERYLAALGTDLRRENCAERLAASPPAAGDDEIAERQRQLHQALASRCAQLRAQGGPQPTAQ